MTRALPAETVTKVRHRDLREGQNYVTVFSFLYVHTTVFDSSDVPPVPLFFWAVEALADGKIAPGSMCDAERGNQVGYFTKTMGRQTNTSASTKTVICPVLRDNLAAYVPTSVDVYVYDATHRGDEVDCTIAVRLLGAEAGLQWDSDASDPNGSGQDILHLDVVVMTHPSKIYFACDLPEDSYVGGYRWDE